ncbi:MAG: N-acetylmuramoyl-L-alanine amidase [Synechococcales bacterium]|nr:N-acetylmuramoyl-L-alanine amidase [Synechococcales bacterium]
MVSALCLATPVDAARLQFWRFNPSENRLVFTTDQEVRPRAQLIADPTRIVIDLPGVTLGQPATSQVVGGAIREIRVAQFDAQTTRLVIELNPGYTVNPQQIEVRGSTPTQWLVQLPTPELVDTPADPVAAGPPPISTANAAPIVPGAATRLDGVRITPDGLFLQTNGAAPEIDVDRSRDRRRLSIDLENTALSDQLTQPEVVINRFGVNRLIFSQEDTSPPVARVTLELTDEEQDWQTTVSNLGGIVMVPTGGIVAAAAEQPAPQPTPAPAAAAPAPANPTVIQSVELASAASGSQLIIRGDTPLTNVTSGWDRATTDYQIVIPNARLGEAIANPQLPDGGPLLRIRLSQNELNQVVVSLLPAAGVQLGQVVNQPGQPFIALPIQQAGPALPGVTPGATVPLPSVQNGQVVVVIDPGHGGRDPGAVGIGGLQEKNVVLPISLEVAQILQQQGIYVVMTRTTDRAIDLEPRVQVAERADADLFVSIHANAISMSRPDVNGIETYYYSDQGLPLARQIQNSLLQATGGPDRGVRRARFYVIRNTSMPAVLVETGFVTGASDAPRLAQQEYRSLIARAIAQGILLHIQQRF